MPEITIEDICLTACADAFRGDGEIMASPMGPVPALGAKLARATFSPDLLLSDGVASFVRQQAGETPVTEGWIPYRLVFDMLWSGRRHVMMGASQIDRFGNTNISCIGDWSKPKIQLLGARGGPGNTINHTTSYYIPNHSPKTFVEKVDMVSGVGYDRVKELSETARKFHEIRSVITDLGVFSFRTKDNSMSVASLHPGITKAQVEEQTGFALHFPDSIPETRSPTEDELAIITSWR